MYEDEDLWPMRCPLCGHGFTAKIRHLKSGVVTKCVGCSNDLGHSAEEFYLALSEARRSKLNPLWDMVREEAFNLFLRMDADQRAGVIARQQDRMAKEPALNQPRC
jgi:hypothetical protein